MTVVARVSTDLSRSYIKEAERKKDEALKALDDALAKAKKGEKFHEEIAQERHAAMYSIMFSVFALEAYINKQGYERLEPDIWEKYKESFSLGQKWHIFPLLICGKTFDINSPLFNNFRKIIKWRNYLVHYKDYAFTDTTKHPTGTNISKIYKITNAKNAKLAYDTAMELMSEFGKIVKK